MQIRPSLGQGVSLALLLLGAFGVSRPCFANQSIGDPYNGDALIDDVKIGDYLELQLPVEVLPTTNSSSPVVFDAGKNKPWPIHTEQYRLSWCQMNVISKSPFQNKITLGGGIFFKIDAIKDTCEAATVDGREKTNIWVLPGGRYWRKDNFDENEANTFSYRREMSVSAPLVLNGAGNLVAYASDLGIEKVEFTCSISAYTSMRKIKNTNFKSENLNFELSMIEDLSENKIRFRVGLNQ